MTINLIRRISFFLCLAVVSLHAQQLPHLKEYFFRASVRYNVPAEVLIGIAYSQTHFQKPAMSGSDAIFNDRPAVYGIMALHDDDWFGYSLKEAVRLINIPLESVKYNDYYNILGAAAYLSELAEKFKINRYNLIEWKAVIEEYSGIPQHEVKPYYSYEVFQSLSKGIKSGDIELSPRTDIDINIYPPEVRGIISNKNIESTDYPPAVWDPSPNFTTGSITQSFAVVHMTEGSFSGALSWLKNTASQASSHYIIRSSDGYIVQLVLEANKAWHARCWNSYMLGVEHEGYVGNISYFTDTMYISSAALFKHFCTKFSIPYSRNRIIGHGEWQNSSWTSWMATNYPSIDYTCNTHTDPGTNWDWSFYMQLVSSDTTRPAVTSNLPVANDTVPRTSDIRITFNQKMRKTETQAAFSISPSVAGSFSWTDNQRTLVFTPSTYLTGGTVYQMTISAGAKNYLALSPSSPYSFSFRTDNILAINSTYPSSSATNVIHSPEIQINFSTLLKQSTITGNITFQDAQNQNVATSAMSYSVQSGAGTVSFTPTQQLADNSQYKITVKSTLQDTTGLAYGSNTVITFTTGKKTYIKGTTFDSLEVIGGWKDPNYSGSTVGCDASSAFTITNEKVKTGLYSGKLYYVFTGASGGVCREYCSSKPNQGSLNASRTGYWIYGDQSNNYLEYWFYYNTSTNAILRVDTLNWIGWKFVETPLARINQSGDKLFHSIVIIQNPSGKRTSSIYIDDGQKTEKTQIDINCFIEGLFNAQTNQSLSDTITISIASSTSPYTVLEQQKSVLSTSGSASVSCTTAVINTDYYIVIDHRNSIQTWIKNIQRFSIPFNSFDFTSAKTSAYGDNLKLIGTKYCIFSGDINQDGVVDFTDLAAIDNDAYNYRTGYVVTDINGDGFVDFTDMALTENNAFHYVQSVSP